MRSIFFSLVIALTCTTIADAQTIAIEAGKPVTIAEDGKCETAVAMLRLLWPKVTEAPLVKENAKLTIHLGESKLSKPFQNQTPRLLHNPLPFPQALFTGCWSTSFP